jgi:hypothetical protein
MSAKPPAPTDTAPDAQRQALALQVEVLTRLRMAAAARGEYRTLKLLSRRLTAAKAQLAALKREA